MTNAKAGWAETEITPPLGLPMGGRGTLFTPAAAVLDPLVAQVLVLEDAKGQRTLWVSMDMIGLSHYATSPFRYELAAMTGIPYEAIVLNFSHTHSGPMTGFEGYATQLPKPEALQAYETSLVDITIRLACQAIAKLQPVRVVSHWGRSEIGINRRRPNQRGVMEMNPNPAGTYNPDLWVLDVAALNGERCLVFSYGCHPVIVYSYAYDSISADFPGVCRRQLRQNLGPEVHTQFIQGLAGNIRPRHLADLDQGRFRPAGPEDPLAVGTQLADDVLVALNSGGTPLDLDLKAVAGFAMAAKDQGAIQPLEHWQSLAASSKEIERNLGSYWVDRLQKNLPPIAALPWELGLIRLAPNQHIAWLAGEALAEWLNYLRRWLNDKNLVAWGYCQEGRGYMPPDAVIAEGGYEVITSNTYNKAGPGPFAAGINDAARRTFFKLVQQLSGG